MVEFFEVMRERQGQLVHALVEHIQISLITLVIAVVIAVPLGIYLSRKDKIAESVIGTSAVLQTIPSLALLGLMIPLVGIGKFPAIIALVIYALLPILRNTFTGIRGVDPSFIEAANAMGMNSRKRLIKVELPLALPVIMAGIRTAMVLIVGTTTLAALIGAGGLGDIILLGIDRNNHLLIILGAIPAALLAILFDAILRLIQRVSKRSLKAIGVVALAVIVIGIVPFLWGTQKKEIVIGGKIGSEPAILINMYKLLIEQDTDLDVALEPNLGKTSFVFNALKSGDIDIYPEFTGTVITTFLKEEPVSTKRQAVYQQAKTGLHKDFDMVLLKPMKYNNTYALAVTEKIAEQYSLNTISDLKQVEDRVKAGFTLEFTDRQDGYQGIQELYDLHFSHLKTMEPKLRYISVKSGDINLVDAYSTDSELVRYHLRVLKDNKNLFPPYQGAPLFRQETLENYPELRSILNQLAGKITNQEMQTMNYDVNVEGQSPRSVAKEYLTEEGLLN